MESMFISVVIPCYGSENTIESVVSDVVNALNTIACSYEIILVNDCSPDNVWEKINELYRKYPNNIIGINFTKNFGQHAALLAGFRESKGDIVISLDDDGQTNPKYIPDLINKLNEGYDVVTARYPELKETMFRRLGSWLNRKTSEWLINKPKNINGTSFCAYKRHIINNIIDYNKPYPYIGGLIYRATQNIGEVRIDHQDRASGQSGYSITKLIKLYMNGFTAFSVKPLRISSIIGILFAIIGFVYGMVIIVRKLVYPSVQVGYSSMMAVLLFVGGMILLSLGLIGEYIGRIYISINNSPQYVIKERINEKQ